MTSAMISRIIVGTDECPTYGIAKIIKSSKDFHLLLKKWPSFAADLAINQLDIEKRKQNLLLEKQQLSEVVHDVIALWVGKNGSGATLDKLISVLESNELGTFSDLIKDEFTMKSSDWDVPSYYISRTVISRTILDKNKLIEEFQTSKDIFVFSGISLSKLSNILKNKMVVNSTIVTQERSIKYNYIILDYPTHFNKIYEKSTVPVHLIKTDENNDKWVHIKSHRGLSALRNLTDTSQDYLTEAELINSFDSKVYPVCISDSPGMGKSTLLHSIGLQLSKKDSEKVLFATMNEFAKVFIQNNVQNKTKFALELTLYKLFCHNPAQRSSLSFKLNSKNPQIELLLDGLDEVASSNTLVAFDLLKYLSTVPSIRVWVTTRPHLLHQVEDCLDVFGYNIQAFTKQNQIRFLKDFWLSHNGNLVTDRLEQFAEICLSELNKKLSIKEKDVAGIPLQCLLVGEVFEEQATEHSDATNPNERWMLQINSLVGLYQQLIEKQYNKYRKNYVINFLSEEEVEPQHVRLAVQLIFPELLGMLPASYKEDVNLNELLKVGLLEKSSTVLEPKFVHRTIGEFLLAKFLVQLSNSRSDKESLKLRHHFIDHVFKQEKTNVNFNIKSIYHNYNDYAFCFVNDEICYFLDSLVTKHERIFFSTQLHSKELAEACIYGDYFNLFKAIMLSRKLKKEFLALDIFNKNLLLLAIKFSGLSFLEIISEKNPTLFNDPFVKADSFLLSIRSGKLSHVQYLLNVKNVRELVKRHNDGVQLALHECVNESVSDSIYIVNISKYIVG